ncbi:unnamed protein product [Staurois parvus]|uniref:Uncharacterized protein n=1 Tax=Staurois parvus TaxID=386267 RepID=A0ABN9ERF8_9NEOB|nr:unnamed protein product [Staurois parvus]
MRTDGHSLVGTLTCTDTNGHSLVGTDIALTGTDIHTGWH